MLLWFLFLGLSIWLLAEWWRVAVASIILLCVAFVSLPGRSIDVNGLRERYVDCVARYEGVRYCWGGESFLGIDCSGLVRRGMIDACLLEGISQFNPALVRHALFLWWNDCSAKALGNHYRGLTQKINRYEALNEISDAQLKKGDMAVTFDGAHVLVYSGNGRWVEADPIPRKVVEVKVPSDLCWFNVPVNIVRWKLLE